MKLNNLAAYLNERFPVVNMALFAVLFLTVYSVASFFGTVTTVRFSGREIGGMLAVISFFFRLRVFDEIKDYAQDAVNHPQRVLQSGRVTLHQLLNLALAGALLEMAWSLTMGMPTLTGWGLAVGYSLLMRYEFFVADYLKKRLVLYAFTHMLVMPFVIGWLWSAYVPVFRLTPPLLLLAALGLLGGFSFEVARKLHAPDAEKAGIDSYSKSLGYPGAIGAVLGILLISVATQWALLTMLRATVLPFVAISLLYLLTLTSYLIALRRPREASLKRAELLVSLAMLVSYLAIILVVNVRFQ